MDRQIEDYEAPVMLEAGRFAELTVGLDYAGDEEGYNSYVSV